MQSDSASTITNSNSEFVEKHYVMNPDTEDLLINGHQLKNGMQVLVEDDYYRVGLFNISASPEIMEKALRFNRWAIVSKLVFDNSNVAFVAIYPDRTKKVIRIPIWEGWYVKINTIPQVDLQEDYAISARTNQTPAPIVENIVVQTQAEAEKVINVLNKMISKHHEATVSDLYDLVGMPTVYADTCWGWTNLSNVKVVTVSEGYLLDFPSIEALH